MQSDPGGEGYRFTEAQIRTSRRKLWSAVSDAAEKSRRTGPEKRLLDEAMRKSFTFKNVS